MEPVVKNKGVQRVKITTITTKEKDSLNQFPFKFVLFIDRASLRPKKIAHNSAWRTLPIPMNLGKPIIQFPCSLCIHPPTPNNDSLIEPSVFSFIHEWEGGFAKQQSFC